jgi:hypothetical protein
VDSPPKRESAQARKKLKKRGAYPKSGARLVRLCSLVLRGSFEGIVIMVLAFVFILPPYQDINGQEEPSILGRAK